MGENMRTFMRAVMCGYVRDCCVQVYAPGSAPAYVPGYAHKGMRGVCASVCARVRQCMRASAYARGYARGVKPLVLNILLGAEVNFASFFFFFCFKCAYMVCR